MERIGIHCKTKEEFEKVRAKIKQSTTHEWDELNGQEVCFYINPMGWDRYSVAKQTGIEIISAQEYLGGRMGGNDFKIPPEPYKGCFEDIFKDGGCDNWTGEGEIECAGISCQYCILSESNINELKKYLSKENNMKENNINKNVLEVFGDLSAKEVVIIDRHFTDEMLKVIMMKKFSKEINAACMEAEEKLKENID